MVRVRLSGKARSNRRHAGTRLVVLLTVFALIAAACGGDDDGGTTGSEATGGEATGGEATGGEATGGAGGELEGKEILFVTYWLDNYGLALAAHMEGYVTERGGTLTVVDGAADATEQLANIDNAITRGVGGIIWQPVDTGGAGPTIRSIQEAGIPLVTYGGYVDPEIASATVPQAIIDDSEAGFEMGVNAANFVTESLDDVPKAVIFDEVNEPISHGRAEGFVQGLLSVRPDTEIVFRDNVTPESDKARELMQNIITATPDFNVVLAYAADNSVGAMSALNSAGRCEATDKVPTTEWLSSFDGTPPQLEALFDPTSCMMNVVTITPKENALQMLELLIRVIDGSLAPDADEVLTTSGSILPAECEAASAVFEEQYGPIESYEPLDCDALGG
jgi:ABC-type sugar transport system substrate-binding protein